MLGVLCHEFVVEAGAVLDRQSVVVQLADLVDVVVVDFTIGEGQLPGHPN